MTFAFEAQKGTPRPYFAKLSWSDGKLQRAFASMSKFTNRYALGRIDAEPGDVLEFRGRQWDGQEVNSHYGCLLVTLHGGVTISRADAEHILQQQKKAEMIFWIDDGHTCVRLDTGLPCGDLEDGIGDGAGILWEDGTVTRFVGEGIHHRIANTHWSFFNGVSDAPVTTIPRFVSKAAEADDIITERKDTISIEECRTLLDGVRKGSYTSDLDDLIDLLQRPEVDETKFRNLVERF